MTRDSFDMFKEPERGRFGDNEAQRRPGRGPKVTGKSDLHDFALRLKHEKPAAIAVVDPARPHLNEGKWVWLPKSQIEYQLGEAGMIVVTLPEWLAMEKGFI